MNDRYEVCATAALDLLSAWGHQQPDEVLLALGSAIEAGGRPGVMVVTGADYPELHVVLKLRDGIVTLARLAAVAKDSVQ